MAKLQGFAKEGFPETPADRLTQGDVHGWLSGKEPGHLITRLITDIGALPADQTRKHRGFKSKTITMSFTEMRHHLEDIRHDEFLPANYNRRGYVLRGSIKTDGFLLQLLAYKLNELNCVRFKRLPEHKLPARITTTLAGTDYYLTEIRNIVKSKQDVYDLWGCEPEKIKILGLDPGQAFVVGASAILPRKKPSTMPRFFNLAVNQKAVYQPTFKHRRWLERKKERMIYNGKSIAEIESSLPPLRGERASVREYIKKLDEVETHLESFYTGSNTIKKHRWNARRAREEEYKQITDSLLRMVGGSVGRKRYNKDKVVIAVGLGKFSSSTRLSSLHQSFESYFIQKVSPWLRLRASMTLLVTTRTNQSSLFSSGPFSRISRRGSKRVLHLKEVPGLPQFCWPG